MSDNKNIKTPISGVSENPDSNVAPSEVSSVAGSVRTTKSQRATSTSERQIKFEKAQRCLENAALVSKRIKEHRKATAELLGKPFEDDDACDTASEIASNVSERTGYSVATDTSAAMSVQDALNIPGISESLANTLKQKEILMERIKQYKEISKRPSIMKSSPISKRDTTAETKLDVRKTTPLDSTTLLQLQSTIQEKENALSIVQVKMRAMETTILDLQEKISEKDQIIEAKNKATTLMSGSISKKEKDALVLLEDTRQQMSKMQENFIAMETEWREEKQKLVNDIKAKDDRIHNLEEANNILEAARFEISVAHSKIAEELDARNKLISELEDKLLKLETSSDQEEKEKQPEEEKGSLEISNMEELSKRIELLEQLNCQMRQANKELENKLASVNPATKPAAAGSPSKKASPLPARKGKNTRMKSPWSNVSSESIPQEVDKKQTKTETNKNDAVIQSLNKDILDKEYLISQKDSLISELEKSVSEKESIIRELEESKVNTETRDIGVDAEFIEKEEFEAPEHKKNVFQVESAPSEDTPMTVEELQTKLKEAQDQIELLNNEIEAANKNMVKVKSAHKLKIKQMQKTIDNFTKGSDSNAEIVKLNEELHQLSQKVAELEEEKGNLQLHLVDYDSGRMTESDSYKKMMEMETLAETRLKAISVLEAQKFDLVQELHILQRNNVEMEDKLADMTQLQNEQVSSEMRSVQLEEELDNVVASKKECELVIENLKLDKDQLNDTIKHLQEEQQNMLHKLEHYVQENMELTDKLEKLSVEKVSSAESIEIVESLTTQEKLELEEYNKGLIGHKSDNTQSAEPGAEYNENIEKLVQESAELNSKIELFTLERQEVMEKMNKLSHDNEVLQQKIFELQSHTTHLQNNIQLINNEKQELESLNDSLNRQIEELKRERVEVMKDAVDSNKPVVVEESADAMKDSQQEDKLAGDKGNKGAKTVKQLTKEILKLKNTIKERENEIADCEMRILSLEEQQQKNTEVLQAHAANEAKIKALTEENASIKEEITTLKQNKDVENQIIQLRENNNLLQNEIARIEQDRLSSVNVRDLKIQELENLLLEYEKQIHSYVNSIQQKDKELSEYINQVTKLNEVSQKLKSTVELLEEEKAKDQNADLVKSLNKQVAAYQKKLAECEERLRVMEDEKSQLLNLKAALETKNNTLETELKELNDSLSEKQSLIKDLQLQKDKFSEEMAAFTEQTKERDEEIHEIKLQLRKESIENEKLRDDLFEKEKTISGYVEELANIQEKLNTSNVQSDEVNNQTEILETKNKELMEKLKKFAANLKKRTVMYAELEAQYNEVQNQLEKKNYEIEQLAIQIESLPSTQEKLKHAEEELNRLMTLKAQLEQQRYDEITQLQNHCRMVEENLTSANYNVEHLTQSLTALNNDLQCAREENAALNAQVAALNNKIVELEIEQRNNINLVTKISGLENEILQKQSQLNELMQKSEGQEQMLNQVQFGQDAKIQERDLYIEGLEAEISKYKNRIYRLEESVSTMEDRRHSLERKADQLGCQLEEKHKAYQEYTSQEDELVSRLVVLMDHDRVLEKQLHEIENENRDLQNKIQSFNDENQKLKKVLSELQEQCFVYKDKADKADLYETEVLSNQEKVRNLEVELKRVTHEHQTLLSKSRLDIEELEVEFNTQIENAIKEKKTLSEKYEKINEHVAQLERKLQEYQINIQNLNANLDEMSRVNQELTEKNVERVQAPDYTEQYISEINRLNSIVNAKNQEFEDLYRKHQSMHATFEAKLAELNEKHKQYSTDTNNLLSENAYLKQSNEQLLSSLTQKEDQVNELKKKKTVTFEMNIPKTEGMIISSTIEPLSDAPPGRECDVTALESQIVSDIPTVKDGKLGVVTKPDSSDKPDGKQVVEEVISPKKAYLCYKGDDETQAVSDENIDPFNSDEGWGLGDTADADEVMPGFTHFNAQIAQLQGENESLKSELAANNSKLLKAMKKLKELKSSNDMLTKELNISKQISQSSFLDTAIEDELKNHIQELEKQVEELNKELSKEKKEKASIIKQNEVFHSANDRLTEMKEKLDNEINLWKFKFKEASDKLESENWGAETKTVSESTAAPPFGKVDSRLSDDIDKLEKENDELMTLTDQLNAQNKELTSKHSKLTNEIISLKKALEQQTSSTEASKELNNKLLALQTENAELGNNNQIITARIVELDESLENAIENNLALKIETDNLSRLIEVKTSEVDETNEKYKASKMENENLRNLIEAKSEEIQQYLEKYNSLKTQYESFQETFHADSRKLVEKCQALDEECKTLKENLEAESNKVLVLTSELEQAKSTIALHENTTPKTSDFDSFALSEKYTGLDDHCRQLQTSLDVANDKVKSLQEDNAELVKQLDQQKEQLIEETSKIERLNSENDKLLSTVTELQTSISTAMDQRGFEIAELWKQHLAQREAEFQTMEQELRSQLLASENKYEQLLDNMQSSSQEETNTLVMVEQVNSLQTKLQDKETHLMELQNKYAEVLGQLDILRSEIDDEKMILENKLMNQQEEYEKLLNDQEAKSKESIESYEKSYNEVRNQLRHSEEANTQLISEKEELSIAVKALEVNLGELSHQIRVKDSEIGQKTHDISITLAQRNEELENLRRQLVEYEKKVEDLSYEKESELAVLRLKMHEKKEYYMKSLSESESEREKLTEELQAKILECTNLNRQITDLNKLLEEQSVKATEMQAALESQELEIVTLKDEIDNLQDLLKASNSRIEKHVSFAADTKPGADDTTEGLNRELLDAVPQAELDLALYMLHQRDVRCEELTMELTQLLEERDTLQLRLSDCLRSYEDLKVRCRSAGLEVLGAGPEAAAAAEATSFVVEREHPSTFVDTHRAQSSRSSSISDPDGDKPKLQAKLSELRSVKQSRDVTLLQDSSERQLGTRLMQRDVANLPPEAVEQLTQAHHTLSRDSASTPTVLLNWLRGKSTPKVVHM